MPRSGIGGSQVGTDTQFSKVAVLETTFDSDQYAVQY